MGKLVLAAVIISSLAGNVSWAAYSGGTGEPNNPYQIANVADFQQLTADPNNWNKSFILTADIGLIGPTFTKAPIAPDISSSDGFQGTQFTGTFDGCSHTISNISVNGGSYIGLFGYVGSGGQIKNLGAVNVNITGYDYVGGLIGWNEAGSITSCYITGSVRGDFIVGGLVGYNDNGLITSCYATGEVRGMFDVGGLVGENYNGPLTSCYAAGSVSGDFYVGGLAGRNSGPITFCYSSSSILGYNLYMCGGLVGVNDGPINSCFVTGQINDVYDACYVGGLVGYNNNEGAISNCYSRGSVACGADSYAVGGLVGWNYSSISNCYSTGSVSGSSEVGGLIGWGIGSVTSCFWDIQASGQASNYYGGRGLTTAQMKTMSLYQNAGWGGNGWVIDDGVDYPHLSWENTAGVPIPPPALPLAGSGTADDPYLISTAQEFALLSWYSEILDKHLMLAVDLDVNNVTLYPIGDIGAFTGVFDGGGHVIRNAAINQPGSDYVGLFSYVDSGGQIRNLGVENVNITGRYNVGGLAGLNCGSITSCYVTGAVSGNRCVGGLVGLSGGQLNCCYSTSLVSGSSYVGGLIGCGGSATSCFWDIQTSGQTGSSGGKGLTTAQMKTMSIYQNAGWAGKGWVMDDGVDYPHLSLENTVGMPIPAPQAVPLAGSGTAEDPYLVTTAQEFALLSWYSDVLDKHIKLTADLDVNNVKLYPIGDLGVFTGVFDGGGYVIRNAAINQPGSDSVGLFSYVDSDGQIRNLGVENVNITGRDSIGGLVGTNGNLFQDEGTITSCYATGLVGGYNRVGGLVGDNWGGSITSCYATGAVSGHNYIGGLGGWNYDGSIISCYATGAVSGHDAIGGLVGYNVKWLNVSSSIAFCYATGAVSGADHVGGLVGSDGESPSTVSNSFWDIQTSGQTIGVGYSSSAGVTGKTTAEMKTLSTFTSASWDFTNETVNGTNDFWRMCVNGLNYPKLSWQSAAGDVSCPDGVAVEDLGDFAGKWILSGCSASNNYCGGADMDKSGSVDIVDFAIFAEHWLEGI